MSAPGLSSTTVSDQFRKALDQAREQARKAGRLLDPQNPDAWRRPKVSK